MVPPSHLTKSPTCAHFLSNRTQNSPLFLPKKKYFWRLEMQGSLRDTPGIRPCKVSISSTFWRRVSDGISAASHLRFFGRRKSLYSNGQLDARRLGDCQEPVETWTALGAPRGFTLKREATNRGRTASCLVADLLGSGANKVVCLSRIGLFLKWIPYALNSPRPVRSETLIQD